MSYQRALEILEAQSDKRLVGNAFYKEKLDCYCAVGAMAPEEAKKLLPGYEGMEQNFSSLANDFTNPFVVAVKRVLSVREAQKLQEFNDGVDIKKPEERYTLVVEWLRARVTKEVHNALATGNAEEVDPTRSAPQG